MTAAEHTLARDGWPHFISHPPYVFGPTPRGRDGDGRAFCSCRRWTSGWLTTTEARRQAHAQHVTEEQS